MGVQQNLYPSYYNLFDREYKKDNLFAYKINQNTKITFACFKNQPLLRFAL